MAFLWRDRKVNASTYSPVKHNDSLDSEDGIADAPTSTKRSSTRNILIASSFINGALVVLLAMTFFRQWPFSKPPRLLESPVPDFPNEVRTFQLDPLYLSLPSEESNEAWESLPGPNGMGFINLEQSDRFDFPDSKAGLSVFHQLHCLGAVRKFMWELVHDQHDREALLRDWPKNVTSPTYHGAIHGLWHIAHCFDYLRQGVQCSADVSLEFVSENTGMAVVDGLDFPHECKKWDAVWDYAKTYA